MAVEEAAGTVARRPIAQRWIDVDVHPSIADTYGALLAYMPRAWQEMLGFLAPLRIRLVAPVRWPHPAGRNVNHRDAVPPQGGPAASDPKFLAEHLLDGWGADYALLSSIEAAFHGSGASDPENSAAFVSAFNDYMIDRWLEDRRCLYALAVSALNPRAAAAEVRRHGQNPQVAAVYLPQWSLPLGNEHFHPIYEAAIEHGLPIYTHPTATEALFQGAAPNVYVPVDYGERLSSVWQVPEANLTSLIFRGTFERYPDLKVLFVESGFSWAMSHMWHMDKTWREVRKQSPWIRRFPSEYVHDHVRFATQPIPEPRDHEDLEWMVERHFADTLCFSTDYPHWDGDRPGTILTGLKPETLRKIYYENARATLRLPSA